MRELGVLLTVIVLAALAGCSGGASDAGGGGTGPVEHPPSGSAGTYAVDELSAAERAAATSLAEAVCAAVEPCCAAAERSVDAFCVENGLELLAHDAVATRGAGARFDLTAVAACEAALSTALASCSDADRASLLATCLAAFPGARAAGEPCASDAECGRPAGAFALCAAGGEEAARCVDGFCELACEAPDHPFDTWKTCATVEGGLDQDSVCNDRCSYPPADSGSVCMMVCTCCVDNTNRTCEYTAFRTAEDYHHYLCTGGHFSTECQAARQNAEQTCAEWR